MRFSCLRSGSRGPFRRGGLPASGGALLRSGRSMQNAQHVTNAGFPVRSISRVVGLQLSGNFSDLSPLFCSASRRRGLFLPGLRVSRQPAHHRAIGIALLPLQAQDFLQGFEWRGSHAPPMPSSAPLGSRSSNAIPVASVPM